MAKRLETVEIDGKKYAPLDGDGNPSLIDDEGKKGAFDYQSALSDNARLRGFSKDRDEWEAQRRTFADKVSAFEKLGKSPDEIAEALRVVSGLKAKDLVEAKQVEGLVAERVTEGLRKASEKEAAAEARDKATRDRVRGLLLQNAVLESKRAGALSKTNLLPVAARLMFGDHYELTESEDGGFGLVPYRDAGRKEKFYNTEGKVGSFDEALAEILRSHPDSKEFTLGVNAAGGAAPGGKTDTGAAGSGKVMSRAAYRDASPAARLDFSRAGGTLTD